MKNNTELPTSISSVSGLHQFLGLGKPKHPLISLITFGEIKNKAYSIQHKLILNCFAVVLKRDFDGKVGYGQRNYDFNKGLMSFMAPGQVIAEAAAGELPSAGWFLIFNPDFLNGHPLNNKIGLYKFFSYSISEALFLTPEEEKQIENTMMAIKKEYSAETDSVFEDIIISQIELLLLYSQRFYNRQFNTRKPEYNDLLTKMENILNDYFKTEKTMELGLPTVGFLAERLNISPNYLTDMLKEITGKPTQQHLQEKILEQAKRELTGSKLSVSQVSLRLGFEHPQSFNKFFKNKTGTSPKKYRESFLRSELN